MGASRIARTTPSLRAPALTTRVELAGSIPPIAKKGSVTSRAACGDQLEADRRSSRFGRRLPDRADADVVDRQLGGSSDLILGVGREAEDRIGAEHLSRLLDRDIVLADVDSVGVAAARQVGDRR